MPGDKGKLLTPQPLTCSDVLEARQSVKQLVECSRELNATTANLVESSKAVIERSQITLTVCRARYP
jgi:hypothetical protein